MGRGFEHYEHWLGYQRITGIAVLLGSCTALDGKGEYRIINRLSSDNTLSRTRESRRQSLNC